MRYLLISWFITLGAMANMNLYPSKECELFNNLKHTKNRGNEVLKLDRTYEMLKHHKGQYLLKVEYATPPQRWVDDNCLTLRPLRSSPLYQANQKTSVSKTISTKKVFIEAELARANANINTQPLKSKQNLLALSWHNAFCETHRYKKECKRGLGSLIRSKPSETQFILHGLWPQPRHNVYCNIDNSLMYADKNKRWRELPYLMLDKEVKDALEKVMPGYASDLHKHEWVKHGSCYGTEANRYFSDAVNLVKQVNESALGKYFSQNIGKQVTLKELRILADRTFGRGTGNRLELQCKGGLVTELWLHLGSGSNDLATLLQRGKQTRSRCQQGRIDKAGFGR